MLNRIQGSGLMGVVLFAVAACAPAHIAVDPPPDDGLDAAPGLPAAPVPAVEVDIERAFPITADDVGDLLVASGTVVGTPAPNGFFLRTPRNHIVFVQSTVPVTAGQEARVVGPLQAADAAVFDGWERTVLGLLAPDWDLLRLYYVRANAVTVEVDVETAFPITDDDVGDVMFASGTVVGTPGPAGFFLRTQRNHVVFVESAVPVVVGQRVRAAGPLKAVQMPVFDGWQSTLLGTVQPDWDLLRMYYIDASVLAVETTVESAYPIGPEDVGDLMLLSGTVVGTPRPTGFFVRAGDRRVLFVESAVSVAAGQDVRVVGPMRSAAVPVFDGWVRESLGQLSPDWDLLRLYYVDADTVTVVP